MAYDFTLKVWGPMVEANAMTSSLEFKLTVRGVD